MSRCCSKELVKIGFEVLSLRTTIDPKIINATPRGGNKIWVTDSDWSYYALDRTLLDNLPNGDVVGMRPVWRKLGNDELELLGFLEIKLKRQIFYPVFL